MPIMPAIARRVGAISWMPRMLPLVVAIDSAFDRISRGRLGILDIARLPNLRLRVAGRRTGAIRVTPLLCTPADGGWLIAGSYFGNPKMPQWVYNLRAADSAEIVWKGRRIPIRWAELRGEDRARAWDLMLAQWPNYRLYQERTDRLIPVFRLTPLGDS